jgi:hypothetical protein
VEGIPGNSCRAIENKFLQREQGARSYQVKKTRK